MDNNIPVNIKDPAYEDEPKMIDCEQCEGTGDDFYSCCGDDMRGNDYDLCPTCKEHQGYEEGNKNCQECGGTGKREMTFEEIRDEIEGKKEDKLDL